MRSSSRAAAVAGTVTLAVLLGGCGGDDPAATPAAAGERLVGELGCTSCHSTDGATRVGPTWAGLAGSEVTLTDGTVVQADRAYLARSITDPTAEVVEGYGPVMPDLGLDDEQVAAIVAYLEELG